MEIKESTFDDDKTLQYIRNKSTSKEVQQLLLKNKFDPTINWLLGMYPNMKNIKAFLDTIAYAEGTYSKGDNGYNVLFGGSLFNSYKWHPKIPKKYGKLWTSAAGRYQFMSKTTKTKVDTWDRISSKIGLKDFSPASQDAGAIELIKEQGAFNDIQNGFFESAIRKCNDVWASLPGSPYGQPTKSLIKLKTFYLSRGGIIK